MSRQRPRRIAEGRRTVFFLDASFDGWDEYGCAETVDRTFVFASRRQAKKAAQYIEKHCGELFWVRLQRAVQDDLFYTGWTINRRSIAPRLVLARPPQ